MTSLTESYTHVRSLFGTKEGMKKLLSVFNKCSLQRFM